jgi:hypothetical protein
MVFWKKRRKNPLNREKTLFRGDFVGFCREKRGNGKRLLSQFGVPVRWDKGVLPPRFCQEQADRMS